MVFTLRQPVLFHHCDPAGLVFYPRYFEMANAAVEAWFAERLKISFAELHGPMALAVPTVALQAGFAAPSHHGETLDVALRAVRLGRSSLGLSTEATCGGRRRFAMTSTLVLTDRGGGSRPWPDELRDRIEAELAEDAP